MLDQRARLLFAALGFVGLRTHPTDAVIDRLHRWLDSWSGIGHVVTGMARQGYDVELRRYDGQGWRATFYAEGFEHSAHCVLRQRLGADSVGSDPTRGG